MYLAGGRWKEGGDTKMKTGSSVGALRSAFRSKSKLQSRFLDS